jgi:predicted nucleic acid-binding protein
VRYLLDVNALVAFGLDTHQFHGRVSDWIYTEESIVLATCPTTELGFVRVIGSVTTYGMAVRDARLLLLRLKESPLFPMDFIPDDHDILHLPAWVTTPKQTTDGHLLQLAAAHGAVLATLDERIPGAYIIP